MLRNEFRTKKSFSNFFDFVKFLTQVRDRPIFSAVFDHVLGSPLPAQTLATASFAAWPPMLGAFAYLVVGNYWTQQLRNRKFLLGDRATQSQVNLRAKITFQLIFTFCFTHFTYSYLRTFRTAALGTHRFEHPVDTLQPA